MGQSARLALPGDTVVIVHDASGQAADIEDAVLALGCTIRASVEADSGELRLLAGEGCAFVVALARAAQRRETARQITDAGGQVRSVVHPRATVSPLASIGAGAAVMAGAVVAPRASIGEYCVVNAGCLIDHDCILGPGTQLGPGVVFPGGVQVGEDAFIGAGAIALPGRVIGRGAVVGAGAVVTRDVPDGVTVAGNPARPRQ